MYKQPHSAHGEQNEVTSFFVKTSQDTVESIKPFVVSDFCESKNCIEPYRTPFLQHITKLPSYLLISFLLALRPLLGPASCKFYPSCGNYTLEQLKTAPLHKALWNSLGQLLSCNPFF